MNEGLWIFWFYARLLKLLNGDVWGEIKQILAEGRITRARREDSEGLKHFCEESFE